MNDILWWPSILVVRSIVGDGLRTRRRSSSDPRTSRDAPTVQGKVVESRRGESVQLQPKRDGDERGILSPIANRRPSGEDKDVVASGDPKGVAHGRTCPANTLKLESETSQRGEAERPAAVREPSHA